MISGSLASLVKPFSFQQINKAPCPAAGPVRGARRAPRGLRGSGLPRRRSFLPARRTRSSDSERSGARSPLPPAEGRSPARGTGAEGAAAEAPPALAMREKPRPPGGTPAAPPLAVAAPASAPVAVPAAAVAAAAADAAAAAGAPPRRPAWASGSRWSGPRTLSRPPGPPRRRPLGQRLARRPGAAQRPPVDHGLERHQLPRRHSAHANRAPPGRRRGPAPPPVPAG